MRKGFGASAALILLLSALAAVYGLGFSYPRYITPRGSGPEFEAIHGDGWLVDGAEIRLADLSQRGNRVELALNAWRPGDAAPARMKISLCGEPLTELTVDSNSSPRLPLRGSCEPRTLGFDVLNPIVASPTDSRQIGAQLIHAKIGSRIGVPILALPMLFCGFALIASLALTYLYALRASPARYAALLVPVCAGLLIAFSDFPDFSNVTSLWLIFFSAGLGMIACQRGGEGTGQLVNPSERPREDASGRSLAVLVAGVVLLGGCLRFYGLKFGLPANFHPDEVPKINAITRMIQNGNMNPQYFLHPSLLLYSTYLMNSIFHWVGYAEGPWLQSAFLAGRTVSAIAGTLSVLLTYLIGARLCSRRTGLVAAAILAVLPLHVTCSRYLKEDSLLLFWILACLLALLKAVQEDRKLLLLLSGLLAGAAASTKYSGILCVAIVASAPWLRSRRAIPDFAYLKYSVLAVMLGPVGFVLCSPYTILDSAKFLTDFRSEQHHMSRGHTTAIDAWSQFWVYHFTHSILPGMTLLPALLGTAAIGFLAWRRRIEDLFLIGLVLLFYLPAEYVKAKPAPQPDRYILPCLPFLAIAAGELVRRMAVSSRIWALTPAVILLLLVAPADRTIEMASEIKHDTRTQMAEWMIANLPRGAKIYMDWKPYCPRFWHDEFHVTYVPRATIMQQLDIRGLRKADQDYLVLSSLFYDRYFSQPDSKPAFRQRFRDIFERVPIVKQFRPRFGTYGFHNPTVTLFSLRQEDFDRLDQELVLKRSGKIDKTGNELRASLKFSRGSADEDEEGDE